MIDLLLLPAFMLPCFYYGHSAIGLSASMVGGTGSSLGGLSESQRDQSIEDLV